MTQPRFNSLKRFSLGIGTVALLGIVGGIAWTFTPSYSVYHIQQALETHDYERFAKYVDMERVVGNAFDELGLKKQAKKEPPSSRDSLVRLLSKSIQTLSSEIRNVVSAGVEIAIEQTISDRSRALPKIPTFAVVGAVFAEKTEDGLRSSPIPLKNGEKIEIKMDKSAEGVWRVVEVTNIQALLDQLKQRYVEKK